MAGGQGSRLRPLTCELPKPMVPIVNYPVMEYIIQLLKRHGVIDIAVTTYYLPEMIEGYFGNGSKWGVNLQYYIEEEPLGTAGSVHNADQFLNETFIVISGDAITDFDLDQAISFHKDKEAEATLVMAREDIPLDYGVIMTDDTGRIVRFLEKPNWGQVFSDTINTGIYIIEPTIFDLYVKENKFDFSKDLFPMMLSDGRKLYGIALNGYWNDIGSLEEFYNTQFDLLSGKIDLPVQACAELDENIWAENGVEIDESAEINGPVYIGEGSIIERGVRLENCVIGRNCRIKTKASLKKAVLWDNNIIGNGCELRGCILANNVTIKERAEIFDRVAIGKMATIGQNARIKPGVKIWPEKIIDDQTTVDTNVVWPTHWSRNVFSNKGIVGESNIDITPEFVSNIAVAYGSTLKKGNDIIISTDNYSISHALKRAMIGGLQVAGIDVIDIGECTTAVTRFSVVNLAASGGVHIRLSYNNPGKSIIEFLDENGVHLSVNGQKGIEKKYFTRDYNRVSASEIGDFAYAPDMPRHYISSLLDNIDTEQIKKNYFSLVVDYEHDGLADILPLFLKKLNCQLLSTKNYSSNKIPLSIQERMKISQRVARIITDNDSDLGIVIDHNGEELHLVTGNGVVLNKTYYQVLISYLLLERGVSKLYLPVNSPMVIETMAEDYGSKVEYTAINPQVPMENYYKNIKETTGENPVYFYPYQDGVAGLGLVLEKMARENINLEQLLNRLPEFYLNNAEINCDWRSKGKVMRHLSQDTDDNNDLIDGIKFTHPQGWALVVPDSERPVFHIFAEGEDMETAESLTGFYLDKVKEIMHSNE